MRYSVEMVGWDVGDCGILRGTATHCILYFISNYILSDYRRLDNS